MNQPNLGGYLPPDFLYEVEPCLIRHKEHNPFLHSIKLKTAPPEHRVIDRYAAMHQDEGSDEFLEKSENVSKEVAQTLINWSSKYFGFIIGTQEALDFLAGNVPSDFDIPKLVGQIETHVITALLKELTRVLAIDNLSCHSDIVSQVLALGGTPQTSTTGDTLSRFIQLAKAAQAEKG